MKKEPMITRVAIPVTGNDWNPIFNSIIVEPGDLASGSFLKITGCDVEDNDATICLEWAEWDQLVEVVAKYRETWDWSDETSKSQDSTSELKQDKERLDWLLKNCLIKELDLGWVHDSRETIDEAMKVEQ